MILPVAIHEHVSSAPFKNYCVTGSGADFTFLRTPAGFDLAASAWRSA
jgi:hypothetical protein